MHLAVAILLASGLASILAGQGLYPEGADIPRYMTPWEKIIWELNPPLVMGTAPPEGLVRCVAEYEPMEGLLVSYDGTSSQNATLTQIAKLATTLGSAKMYVVVDTVSEQNTVSSQLQAAGVDLNKCEFIVVSTNTIWMRDYGPRYIYQGDCRAMVDHIYNRPRPQDDAFPSAFAQRKNHARYEIPLIHGGGNFHLNALGNANVTRLVNNENQNYTEQQIWQLWKDYQNVDTTFWTPFPTNVDSTQHIDMWMQITADKTIVISDWPYNAGSLQDQICDDAAAQFQSAGWSVYRTPARSVGGVHYTYTNVVMCNGLVIIPTYSNSSVQQHNAEALSVWQSACPDKQIVQLSGDSLVASAGVFHCVVMHVPQPKKGAMPSAYVISPNGNETFQPGQQVEIKWVTDDDKGIARVDILLSTNNGLSYDRVIAADTDDDGTFLWTVPNLKAPLCRVKIQVRDGDGNVGDDDSDGSFAIRRPLKTIRP